jgi:hypothetical protein
VWIGVLMMCLTSCGQSTPEITSTPLATLPSPLPFAHISTPPTDKFILIALGDDDYTCLDGLCDCPMVEAAAPPFGFSNGILQINSYYLIGKDVMSLNETDQWLAIKKAKQAIGLFGFYGQVEEYLTFILSFPFTLDRFGLEILGFDLQGSIQIKTKDDGFSILLPNEEYNTEQPELRSQDCKVLNKLTLKNYGFMDDSNVVFSVDYAGDGSRFPP